MHSIEIVQRALEVPLREALRPNQCLHTPVPVVQVVLSGEHVQGGSQTALRPEGGMRTHCRNGHQYVDSPRNWYLARNQTVVRCRDCERERGRRKREAADRARLAQWGQLALGVEA